MEKSILDLKKRTFAPSNTQGERNRLLNKSAFPSPMFWLAIESHNPGRLRPSPVKAPRIFPVALF